MTPKVVLARNYLTWIRFCNSVKGRSNTVDTQLRRYMSGRTMTGFQAYCKVESSAGMRARRVRRQLAIQVWDCLSRCEPGVGCRSSTLVEE